jgi:hypothetical protein
MKQVDMHSTSLYNQIILANEAGCMDISFHADWEPGPNMDARQNNHAVYSKQGAGMLGSLPSIYIFCQWYSTTSSLFCTLFLYLLPSSFVFVSKYIAAPFKT